jgi:hypothetical protein
MDFDPIADRFRLDRIGIQSCPGCSDPVQAISAFGRVWHECPRCAEAEKQQRRQREKIDRALAQWAVVTPPTYREKIDRSRIHPTIALAMDLDFSSGIGLVGPSGIGKTRVAFFALRMASARGLMPGRVTSAEYREAVSLRHSGAKETASRAEELIRMCKWSRALLIDDIGKGANTPAGDEAFYNLLEHRRAEKLLTFWTSNGGSGWLRKKLGADYGPAIVKRLVDLATGPDGYRIFSTQEES